MTIPQETVEAILLTQPGGLLQLMFNMGEYLRAEVRQLFPTLTLGEHLAVCDMVTIMMREAIEKARLEMGSRVDDDA